MGKHSIAEAKQQLSELIVRARGGEAIVITEDGTPVAEIKPLASTAAEMPSAGASMAEWLDWLRINRVGDKEPTEDAATLVRGMRDEDDH